MANANTAADIIRERIRAAGGSLPWAEVMQIALYEPGAGYYRRGVRRIGRTGDFFTSVSVGPAFGELLGLFVEREWRGAGAPQDFVIIEQGAHDGTLAADILRGLERKSPELFANVRYIIVEPDNDHRVAQLKTLANFSSKLSQVNNLNELAAMPEQAVFLCNELPDAMPVHRVQFIDGAWKEMWVRVAPSGEFELGPESLSSTRLADELADIRKVLPDGFITEVNLAMLDWLRELAAAQFSGRILILDYGHSAEDYFAPERRAGSLRRYVAHQSDDRVLENLGECDLTAHVNFTRLAQQALDCGLEISDFIEQGRFLTRLFAESESSSHIPRDAGWLRQFHSLTHPGIMGRAFHALVLGKNLSADDPLTEKLSANARQRLGL
ncbi:MAG: SAM-dependent methyltransferase [Verrucomicrobia bacterium]|nr:SAM-dependent methyltransferase [Verrucomicrobiota bacterium]